MQLISLTKFKIANFLFKKYLLKQVTFLQLAVKYVLINYKQVFSIYEHAHETWTNNLMVKPLQNVAKKHFISDERFQSNL